MTLLASTTAQAQNRVVRQRVIIVRRSFFHPFFYDPFDPYGRFGRSSYYNNYVFSSSESAENQGYNDGRKTGESDAHHNRSYDPERSHYFHDAGFGNYAGAYREGFAGGYAAGFRA